MFKEALHKARAKFEMVRLSKGKGVVNVDIPEIPKEKTRFLDSTDEWEKVILPKSVNSTSCIYYAKKGNFFPPHKHNDSTEQLIILNEGGKLKSITDKGIEIIEYPNSVFYEKGESHAIVWEEDTDVLIVWHPNFKKGWEAEIDDDNVQAR